MVRAGAIAAVSSALLAVGSVAQAYEAPPDLSALSLEQLADIQVTSVSKRAQTAVDAPSAVFVITYGFARSAGGAVRFDSKPGEGSTVCIELPRAHKPLPPAPATAPAVGVAPRAGRVLLVEDDDHVADLVTQMLIELGYESQRVINASAALEALGEAPAFDLVFSDMVMPGEMNGLELVGELARRYPQLPVVLTTGFSNAATLAAEQGVRLLLKPYSMETLQAELAAAMAAGGGKPG